jgi:thiol-disulfide isomerase/thioredoxin
MRLRSVTVVLALAALASQARAEIVGQPIKRAADEAEIKASLSRIELVDESGAPFDLRALLASGKPALVTLWAHWCANCKAEMAGFKKIAAACPEASNIVFVSARAGDYAKDLAKFETYDLPWKLYRVTPDVATDLAKAKTARAFYGATADGGVVTPLHYFVSRRGEVELIVNARMDFENPRRLAAFCAG